MKKQYHTPEFEYLTFADIALMDDPFTDSAGDPKDFDDEINDEEE